MKKLFVLMQDYDGDGVFGDEFSDHDAEVVRQEKRDRMDSDNLPGKRFKIQARKYLRRGRFRVLSEVR